MNGTMTSPRVVLYPKNRGGRTRSWVLLVPHPKPPVPNAMMAAAEFSQGPMQRRLLAQAAFAAASELLIEEVELVDGDCAEEIADALAELGSIVMGRPE